MDSPSGKCWFNVDSKTFEISIEEVKRKVCLGKFVRRVQTFLRGLGLMERAWLCWWKGLRLVALSRMGNPSERFRWKGTYIICLSYATIEQAGFCFALCGMWKKKGFL